MTQDKKPNAPQEATFGATVRKFRMDAKLSIDEAAKKSGFSVISWTEIEEGSRSVKIAGLWPMAIALGVGIQDLLS